MAVALSDTVGELAARSLAAARLFEQLGVDYCCQGNRTLAQVCAEHDLDPAAVERDLTQALSLPQDEQDWSAAPLPDLIDHIVARHHGYLKDRLPFISRLLEKLAGHPQEAEQPAIISLVKVFTPLRAELETHMMKEERILFPAIIALSRAATAGTPPPQTSFGPLSNPVAIMEHEHRFTGNALASMRRLTGGFQIPEGACNTYRALMAGLAELEQDLHLHIHLENNILFPRALKLEASTLQHCAAT
jgi:regulator of cell morphogenesis and NO signaling